MQMNKPKGGSFASNRFNQIEKFYLNKVWTPKLESQFVELYKEHKQLLAVRNDFHKLYQKQKEYFTIASLRSRLYRIIRTALKQTATFCDNMKYCSS